MNQELPQIQLPGGFPAWLVNGHSGTDDDVYASSEMSTGHTRIRRVYWSAPQTRTVSMLLTQSQGMQFFNWFENDLLGGVRRFAAKVRAFGPDHLWYGAMFSDNPPYTADEIIISREEVMWRIDATLTLYGAGDEFGPLATTMESEIVVPLISQSFMTPLPVRMAAEIVVPLIAMQAQRLIAAEIDVALQSEVLESTIDAMYAEIDVALWSESAATRTTLLAAEIIVGLK